MEVVGGLRVRAAGEERCYKRRSDYGGERDRSFEGCGMMRKERPEVLV